MANLVPSYDPSSTGLHGVSAGLEYAVNVLTVSHIVVMGHGGCGGVSASLAGGVPSCSEFVGPWVSLLNDARERVKATETVNPQYALELEGIEVSMSNLRTFPFIAKAEKAGELKIHGAWFAIRHGELHWRNSSSKRFEAVPLHCMLSTSASSKNQQKILDEEKKIRPQQKLSIKDETW